MYKSENFQISLWLVSLMSIILLMIIVGGLTRLTESGLSMVDWRLFMGTIPPLSHGDWLKVFEDKSTHSFIYRPLVDKFR